MLTEKKINGNSVSCTFESSNIKGCEYNYSTKDLDITFNNNTTYRYFKVKEDDFTKFKMAESQGKEFNKTIKRYEYKRLDLIEKENEEKSNSTE